MGQDILRAIINKFNNFIFIKAFYKLIDNNGIEMAGYLAYLTIFAIFPFFLILVSASSSLVNEAQAQEVIESLLNIAPLYLLDIIKPFVNELVNGPGNSMFSLAVVSAIWTSSSLVAAFSSVFNKIYDLPSKNTYLVSRFLSIIYFLLAIFTIIIIILMLILVPKLLTKFGEEWVVDLVRDYDTLKQIILAIVFCFLISGVYILLTSRKLKFIEVLPGALITYFMWVFAGWFLQYYIKHFSQLNKTYGSLAGAIIILMFFYFVNIAILYSAEINRLLFIKRTKASPLEPQGSDS